MHENLPTPKPATNYDVRNQYSYLQMFYRLPRSRRIKEAKRSGVPHIPDDIQ